MLHATGIITAVLVSIIVPHYNDLDNLRQCIRLLVSQRSEDRSYEIIVAENDPQAELATVRTAVAEISPAACVVAVEERGAAAARNGGAAVAQGDILAFTDSDCRPALDWLEAGIMAMDDADIAGGRICVSSEIPGEFKPVEAFEAVFAFDNRYYVNQKGFSASANLFVRRSVFEAVGGFRGHVAEDKDWCLRAGRMGYAINYAADAVVVHPARRNWAELSRKWRRLTREAYMLTLERRFGRTIWWGRSWLVLASPAVDVFKVLTSDRLQHVKDKLNAAAVLVSIRVFRFIEAHRVMLNG